MTSHVTMAHVARCAGVHVTTVSMSLRNHPSIPVETRERVQLLAKRMGYQRDPALSALVAYRTRLRQRGSRPPLAYVTNWDTRWGWKDLPAHRDFFDGAMARASLLGHQLEHFWLGEPGLSQRRLGGILYSRGIAGLIIASHRREYEAPLDFDWSKFSAVKIDFSPRQPLLPIVTNDQRSIIMLAMERAFAAGYRRIGLVMPRWWDEFVDLAWSAGFLAWQQRFAPKNRIPILYFSTLLRGDGLRPDGSDYSVSRSALEKWLRFHRPEVLLSYGPFVESGLAELGISVPGDLAFVEIYLDRPDGRLAGVHHNSLRVGELAVETLVGQMRQHVYGVPAFSTSTIVKGTWFDGRSLPPHPPSAGAKGGPAPRRKPSRRRWSPALAMPAPAQNSPVFPQPAASVRIGPE